MSYENPRCQRCPMHRVANRVCLPGMYPPGDIKLMIYLDSPSFVEDKSGKVMESEAAKLVRWMMARMSISRADYAMDYIIKCYPGKGLPGKKAERMKCIQACAIYRELTLQEIMPRAVVGLGRVACEALTGSHEIGKYEGTWWDISERETREVVPHAWIGYSPGYALQSPAECVAIFRTIWAAAEQAGLKPNINHTLAPFDFSEFIK